MLNAEKHAAATRDTMLTVAQASDDLFARARYNVRQRKATMLAQGDYEVLLRSLEATLGERVMDALKRERSKAECRAILRIVRTLCETE